MRVLANNMTSDSQHLHRQSFEHIEDFIIQPVSVTEEKELYGTFYDRLYQALQEGRLDFSVIAEKTGLKERRLREALLYRLTNEVIQLFGQKPGVCYVCQGRLYQPSTQEPLCLKCLNQTAHAAQSIPKPASLVKEVSGVDGAGEGSFVMISKPEYERMLKELDYYRQKYPEGARALELPTNQQLPPVASPDPEVDKNDVLAILNMDNDELPTVDDWDLVALGIDNNATEADSAVDQLLHAYSNHEPLRHFGFKRIKR